MVHIVDDKDGRWQMVEMVDMLNMVDAKYGNDVRW